MQVSLLGRFLESRSFGGGGGEPWWSTQTRPASNTDYYKQQQSKKMNADRTAADTGPPQQPYSSAHFPCSSPGGIAGP